MCIVYTILLNQCSFSHNFPHFSRLNSPENHVDVLIPIGLNVISAVAKEQIPSWECMLSCRQQICSREFRYMRYYFYFLLLLLGYKIFPRQIHLIIMSHSSFKLHTQRRIHIQTGIIHTQSTHKIIRLNIRSFTRD